MHACLQVLELMGGLYLLTKRVQRHARASKRVQGRGIESPAGSISPSFRARRRSLSPHTSRTSPRASSRGSTSSNEVDPRAELRRSRLSLPGSESPVRAPDRSVAETDRCPADGALPGGDGRGTSYSTQSSSDRPSGSASGSPTPSPLYQPTTQASPTYRPVTHAYTSRTPSPFPASSPAHTSPLPRTSLPSSPTPALREWGGWRPEGPGGDVYYRGGPEHGPRRGFPSELTHRCLVRALLPCPGWPGGSSALRSNSWGEHQGGSAGFE